MHRIRRVEAHNDKVPGLYNYEVFFLFPSSIYET